MASAEQEAVVRKEIEDSLKDQSSQFYQDLAAEIRSKLSIEQASQDASYATSKQELEAKFEKLHDQDFRAMKGAFEEKVNSMVRELEHLMNDARKAWESEWEQDLDAAAKEWSRKWVEREAEWHTLEKAKEKLKKEQDAKFSEDYHNLLETHITKLDAELSENEQRIDLELLEQKLKDLKEAQEALINSETNIDQRVQSKYGEWMGRLQKSHADAVEMLQRQSEEKEKQFVEVIEHEREMHANTCAKLKEEHQQQLDILNETIGRERREMSSAQQYFEESLRNEYSALVQSFRAKVKEEQEVELHRSLDLIEKHTREEALRTRENLEIHAKAEAAAASKFKNLLDEMHRTWEQEEVERAKLLDNRLRGHYDSVIEHMQKQLDAALRLHDEADEQWLEDMENRQKQQVAAMQAFEEKCRHLYDARLKEYMDNVDSDLADYEARLLEAGDQAAKTQREVETRLRRMRLSCVKWRADYQRDAEKSFQQAVTSLEERYTAEIESLLQQLSETQQHSKTLSQRLQEVQNRIDEESHAREKIGKAGSTGTLSNQKLKMIATRDELWGSVKKLWSGLETSDAEKVSTLEHLLDMAEPSEELIRAYESYNSQLAKQLPLVQLATRREILRVRLTSLRRAGVHMASGKPMSEGRTDFIGLNVQSCQDVEQAIQETQDELSELDSQMIKDIKQYNKDSSAPFSFNGLDYLKKIREEKSGEGKLSSLGDKIRSLDSSRLF